MEPARPRPFMLLGLLSPTSGSIELFGHNFVSNGMQYCRMIFVRLMSTFLNA